MPRYSDDQKFECLKIALEQGPTKGAAYLGCSRQAVDRWLQDVPLMTRLGLIGKQAGDKLEHTKRRGPATVVATRFADIMTNKAEAIKNAALQRRETVGVQVDRTLHRVATVLDTNAQPVYDKEGVQVGTRELSPDDLRSLAQTVKLLTDVSRTISGEALAEKLILQKAKTDEKANKQALESMDMADVSEAFVIASESAPESATKVSEST